MNDVLKEFKQIKVMGYTTDFNRCDCCGKENLKGAVSILHLESGVVCHYGTTCAAAAEKYDTLEASKQAKKDVSKVYNSYMALARFGWGVAWKLLRGKYGRDAVNVAPKKEAELLVNDCEKWYTNPDNRMKPYPVTTLN
jgi:hypothetical protein